MKCAVFLVVVTFLSLVRGDAEVSCVVMQRCILPCSFQGEILVLHWMKMGETEITVHSYNENKDQFGHQDLGFRGRTSLFKDQISGGNASLQLTGVKIQDHGRYNCYTRTLNGPKESFVNLRVEDAEVSCVVMQRCILPCSFQGEDLVLHWMKMGETEITVHSYYENKDQFEHQDLGFRGRTSLFKDQISGGNASLQLTRVKIQDQGRYKCYTRTLNGPKESFVNLKVEAPVRRVDIQQVGHRITCSSEGIYPEPQLTWNTNPPSNVTLHNKTTVHQTEQQLYNINSSLIVSDLDYSCSVSTRRNKRTATLFKPTTINVSNTETTIPCTSINTTPTFLIWRFNHSQIILNQTGTSVPYTVSEEWRQQVKSVSESGSLTLKDLSSRQEGAYTCELRDEEETYVANTVLQIIRGSSNYNAAIIGGVAGAIVLAGIGGLIKYLNGRRKRQRGAGPIEQNPAAHELKILVRGEQDAGSPR